MIEINGCKYDESRVQHFGPKLAREFIVAANNVYLKLHGVPNTDAGYQPSTLQKVALEMIKAGLLDVNRLLKDDKYARAMLSVLVSRLAIPDEFNKSNDAEGLIWGLCPHETAETTKPKKTKTLA